MLAILGPTASGKTEVAIEIAGRIGAEVLSVDSMQVYRGMDIGTAKSSVIERRGIRHHMIDVVDPESEFSVAEFRGQGRAVMNSADSPVIITGGSGLHFRALVDPMSFAPTDPTLRSELEGSQLADLVAELKTADPEVGSHVDLANPRRVIRAVEILRLSGETPSKRATTMEAENLARYVSDVDFAAVGLDAEDATETRIDVRLAEMRRSGMTDEVRGLVSRMGRTARGAVGYRELLSHLEGTSTEEEAYRLAAAGTKKLARKQRTWFRRDPRIRWIPWTEDVDQRADRALEALI
ncbi:MAG: tRNA (adenosine(37)-N6)-dimethylallyltransferase MiaA [Actinobacteria bacterium]|nr:tRNA (adenosine(37)-N6)-dimethylallyltransferase MiaA [Actinomycetota bacterium]